MLNIITFASRFGRKREENERLGIRVVSERNK